ncbi:hypothetical protein [Streptomyces sp. YIM S03343]
MADLNYEILTDPAPLQISGTGSGEESTGAVYIVISNALPKKVEWYSIQVEVPCGPADGDLTADGHKITAQIEKPYTVRFGGTPVSTWDPGSGVLEVTAPSPVLSNGVFPEDDTMVLRLDGFPVSSKTGLVRLVVREDSLTGTYPVTLSLLKQAPKVPRSFRAEKPLLDRDAGEQLTLLWDGPTNLNYEIRDQKGNPVHKESATSGPAAYKPFRHQFPFAPQRGTTYTLVATPHGVAGHQGYFLTTTVHAVIPEFESGTRTQWIEGTKNKGRAFFTADGVDVLDHRHDPNNLGRVRAKVADVDSVVTRLVQGRSDADGWITFPERGVNVYHGHNPTPGVITAARADVDGVNTTWVGSRDAGQGWIEFSQPGATVHKDGGQDRGTLSAEKIDVNGLNTKWVGDQDGGNGWIDFPQYGIEVHQDGSSDQGTLRADSAAITNGVNTPWVGDRAHDKGWIGFPQLGIDVRKDGGQAWGTVSADTADLNSVTAQWVEGPNSMKSRLAFTDTGVKITDADGHRGTIVAGETNVRSVVTPWVSGPMPGAGWIAFRVEGVDVMRDSKVSFGTIRAAVYEEKKGGTGRALHRRLDPYDWPPKSDK